MQLANFILGRSLKGSYVNYVLVFTNNEYLGIQIISPIRLIKRVVKVIK